MAKKLKMLDLTEEQRTFAKHLIREVGWDEQAAINEASRCTNIQGLTSNKGRSFETNLRDNAPMDLGPGTRPTVISPANAAAIKRLFKTKVALYEAQGKTHEQALAMAETFVMGK